MSDKNVAPDLTAELASMTRMFHAACADLGLINEALGLDPNDGGAAPILDAIVELKARAALAAPDSLIRRLVASLLTNDTEGSADVVKAMVDYVIPVSTGDRP